MTAVDAVQSWMSELQSSMAGLSGSLEQAAPSGNFAAVLQSVESLLSSGPFASSNSSASESAQSEPASTTTSGGTSEATGSSVVAAAEQFLGVPYVWGGSSPSGFDCSGLVQYVYGELGVSLPRTAAEQAGVGTPIASLADAEPGDLVFFPGSDGTATSPGHVGIYIGNGEMIDAPETGEDVSIQPVGDPSEIRRILPPSAATLTSSSSANSPSYSVPSNLAPDFLSAAATYKLPVQLLTAVAYTESGFDPTAVSPAGAEGIMQLMPSTAAGLGVDPTDPAQAINGAAELLSSYLTQYGSVPLALAAYNAGPAAVAAAGNQVPDIPQTQAYVQKIMGLIGGQST